MTIKVELYRGDFVNIFEQYNRKDQFSVCAREALYDYLEELSDGIGEDVTIDVVSLCCSWYEYDANELLGEYGRYYLPEDREAYETEEEAIDALFLALQDRTTIIELRNGAYLVQAF